MRRNEATQKKSIDATHHELIHSTTPQEFIRGMSTQWFRLIDAGAGRALKILSHACFAPPGIRNIHSRRHGWQLGFNSSPKNEPFSPGWLNSGGNLIKIVPTV